MTTVTIIGPGRQGTAIAQLFASHGIDVVLYHHKAAKAEAAARAVSTVAADATVAVAATLAEAAAASDIIVLATLWDQPQRAVIGELGDALVGKVLVDISNPLDVTPTGIVMRRPAEGSAGQFVHTLLPAGAGHVKAFSSLATAFINESADAEPRAVLPMVADSQASYDRVAPIIDQAGWTPWLVGDISASGDVEIGGRFNTVHGAHGRSRLTADEMLRYAGPERSLS
ncbi:NAD(P)-binding domain-containing protein [Microbacterium gorillae]|uniref:NAD(P)-binding domain-containing protein n=1 Tax=Microbacterium gorillae TaxID=1231063 RepID=UPI0005910B8E|nr:NAD(P)-binding domain-containing protein [Microbacterium gorillae]